ncbi:hypothetical protein [Mycetocola sp. 2940]|uniref:hypothetical protein n=1 Tax=Mycetocola sp. 2940 TaxID=3156452 RepID=UPI003396D918
MPLEIDLLWSFYPLLLLALAITLAVVAIRLMLAATRALNAYTDDRKLRTALALDEVDPADETRVS